MPKAPTPVILIHGLGLSSKIWAPFLGPLQAAGLQVLTYDLYGHGQAGPIPAGQNATLQLYADQILNLMDDHGIDRAHLVGFSIGGMINRRFALSYPGRVTSLSIWNSPHDRGPDLQAEVERRAKAVAAEGPFATLEAALERWFTEDFRSKRTDILDQVRTWRAQVDPASYAGAAWVLAHGVRELTGTNQPRGFPTLVQTCANDTGSTPAMAQAITLDLGAPPPFIIPNYRHLGLLENPKAFLDPLLAFLSQVP